MGGVTTAQGYGSGYAESEIEARLAEAQGDAAKAQRIRSMREAHALSSAATDMLTERIGTLNVLKAPGRGMKLVGDIAEEGIVEEGLAQVVKDIGINPVTLEREATLENVPGAMAAGVLAAGPLVGLGYVQNRRQPQGPPELDFRQCKPWSPSARRRLHLLRRRLRLRVRLRPLAPLSCSVLLSEPGSMTRRCSIRPPHPPPRRRRTRLRLPPSAAAAPPNKCRLTTSARKSCLPPVTLTPCRCAHGSERCT